MAGRLLFIAVVAALAMGFVGWLLSDPPADSSPDTANPDVEGPAESAAIAPVAPHLEGAEPIPGASLGALEDGVQRPIDALIAELATRVYRNSPRNDLTKPDPATYELVVAHRGAWRAQMPTVVAKLSKMLGSWHLEHVLVSVLEASAPLDEVALGRISLMRHAKRWRTPMRNEIAHRLIEVVAASVGDDRFVDVILGNTAYGPHATSPRGWLIDRPVAQVLARFAARNETSAAWIRQRLLDIAAQGRLWNVAAIIKIVDRNDPLAALAPFPRSGIKPNSLGPQRDAFLAALDDAHVYVRLNAVEALHADGVTPANDLRDALLSGFLADSASCRIAARLAPFVLQSVDEFIPTLNAMLARDNPHVANLAADALLRLAPLRGEADMARLVGRILGRAEPAVRLKLVKETSLFRMKPRDEADLLGRQMGDSDARIRLAVVESLGALANAHPSLREAHDVLERAQRDQDKQVADMAAAWLEELRMAGDEQADDNRKPFAHRGTAESKR